MRKIYFCIFFLLLQFNTSGQCNYVWATWRNQGPTDTASASFLVNGATIKLKMSTNYTFDFTPSIYNYTAYSPFSDIPPNATVPRSRWASGIAGAVGQTTVCFSQPVVNPVLLLSSVGSAWITVSLDFSMPFNVLFDGGGNTYVSNVNLVGKEGYCILEFPGTVNCITITSSTPETYTNLTWGLRNPLTASNQTVSLCNGQSYHINSHDYSSTGVYYDTLTTILGCDSIIITNLTISPNVNSTNPQTICFGEKYLFNNHLYSAAGNYYDTLQSVAGCDSIVLTSITINPLPTISFLHPPDVCIEANALALNYASPAGGHYSGAGVSNNMFDPQVASAGMHTLTYMFTAPGTNCVNTAQENITVLPSPVAKLSVTPNFAHLSDSKISFINLSQGVVYSLWEFGDGSSSISNNGVHVYSDTGHFQVSLMVTDAFGCSNYTAVTIYIESEFSFYIPNAFSPDGDGINDYFSGFGAGIDKYNMTIFNRWGDQIFQTTDLNKTWNATNIPADTYVYKINLVDVFGLSHEYAGKISVIR